MSITRFSGPMISGPQFYSDGTRNQNTGFAVLSQGTTLGTALTTANFYVPPNSQIVQFNVDALTAWNTQTSALLSIGTDSLGTAYTGTTFDVKAQTSRINPTLTTTILTLMANVGNTTTVALAVAQTGTAATVGATFVTMLYVQKLGTGEVQ